VKRKVVTYDIVHLLRAREDVTFKKVNLYSKLGGPFVGFRQAL
jgi:hypothetical protein